MPYGFDGILSSIEVIILIACLDIFIQSI